MDAEIPIGLNPLYRFEEDNPPIILRTGRASIGSESAPSFVGDCVVRFRMLPSTDVEWELTNLEPAAGSVATWPTFGELGEFLRFEGVAEQARVLTLSRTIGTERSRLKGVVNGSWELGGAALLNAARFHLANWPMVYGAHIQFQNADGSGSSTCGRIELRDEHWHIALDAIEKHTEAFDRAKATGAYAITHVGEIRATDGHLFTLKEIEPLLEELFWFLSFCRGAWSSPLLIAGLNECGEKIAESYGAARCDRFFSSRNWFAHAEGRVLEELWPLFRQS